MKVIQILLLYFIYSGCVFSQSIEYIDENYTLIQTENSWGIFDQSIGKYVINPIKLKIENADNYSFFSEGLCPAKINGKWSYINSKGEMAFQTVFDKISSFSSGTAIIEKNKKLGLINNKGELLTKIEYDLNDISYLHFDESFKVFYKNKTAILLDKSGKEIIQYSEGFSSIGLFYQTSEAEYSTLFFSENLCPVIKNGKWGFVNSTGKLVITCEYEEIKPFQNNKAAVLKNGKWGIIDNKNNLLIPFLYDDISTWDVYSTYSDWSGYFNSNLCPVAKKTDNEYKWGYLNQSGTLVIPFKYDYPSNFDKNGISEVSENGQTVTINSEGKIIKK